MNNTKLDNNHRAIMFISTKNFTRSREDELKESILSDLGSVVFIGRCFGRFDIVLEMIESSAKVASYKLSTAQERAAKFLKEKYGIDNPLSSSLILCNEFIGDKSTDESFENKPIRLYTFLRPNSLAVMGSKDSLDYVYSQLEKNTRFFFSCSDYTFMLITTGNTFCDTYKDFIRFRENTQSYFLDSCTYAIINWDKEDERCDNGEPLIAQVYIKLKKGFGKLELDGIEDNLQPLGVRIKSISDRFGWSDTCIILEAPTLSALKKAILKIRKGDNILHTSTLLLPEVSIYERQ